MLEFAAIMNTNREYAGIVHRILRRRRRGCSDLRHPWRQLQLGWRGTRSLSVGCHEDNYMAGRPTKTDESYARSAADQVDYAVWRFRADFQRLAEHIAGDEPQSVRALRQLCDTAERDLYPALRESLLELICQSATGGSPLSKYGAEAAEHWSIVSERSEKMFPSPPHSSLRPSGERPKVLREDSVSAPVYGRGSRYR
ncbi:hypothetical protein ThidrDRAFT_4128 [Thiorhodococcus drewsii AZ1]|uniref:Uncharacterized protein n=1 Tax=Thiorhodococcus drewsii AZ1 TaxID=765913 RepID=G2E765_9GAMM|nr:hypothetical protein ThidrDRAFT_4128 [Thiorhodococcus drewsii AZ1]